MTVHLGIVELRFAVAWHFATLLTNLVLNGEKEVTAPGVPSGSTTASLSNGGMSTSGYDYDRLEFKHFKSIVSFAEEGTFTAAASPLRIAQSALSRQIGELEDAFKIQIFERDRAGSTLTPVGESLLRFARRIAPDRVEVVKAVQTIDQATMRPFRLGFTPLIEHEVITAVCDACRRRPGVPNAVASFGYDRS